jgi:hypothetical protein
MGELVGVFRLIARRRSTSKEDEEQHEALHVCPGGVMNRQELHQQNNTSNQQQHRRQQQQQAREIDRESSLAIKQVTLTIGGMTMEPRARGTKQGARYVMR